MTVTAAVAAIADPSANRCCLILPSLPKIPRKSTISTSCPIVVYVCVGLTGLMPEERFANHRAGITEPPELGGVAEPEEKAASVAECCQTPNSVMTTENQGQYLLPR